MEEHSKEFLEKLKGLLAFAKEHKNALEHQEIVDYFKGISLTEIQSEKILDYLDEHGVDVLRQKDADALEDLEEEESRVRRSFRPIIRSITAFRLQQHRIMRLFIRRR